MYCNSCMQIIGKPELIFCSQCGVPLHKDCANHCLECGKVLCDSCFAENDYKCEECYKPNNKFQKIRRSHLQQYDNCPYSLYLQLILGIEPPMGKAAQLGVIVHELIDLTTYEDTTLEEMQSELERRVKEWNEDENTDEEFSKIPQELLEVGKQCIDNFWEIKDVFPKTFDSEKNMVFSIDEDLPKISCTADRVIKNKDGIHIYDWKTGKPMSGKKLIEDLQPPLYIYAVYKEYGEMPKTFTLHYLRNNKIIVYEKVNDENYRVCTSRNAYILNIPSALEKTKKILKGIQNNHFNMPDERTSKWRCENMCWFGKSGKCKTSFNESWSVLSNGERR